MEVMECFWLGSHNDQGILGNVFGVGRCSFPFVDALHISSLSWTLDSRILVIEGYDIDGLGSF